jgi:hypothetical protein
MEAPTGVLSGHYRPAIPFVSWQMTKLCNIIELMCVIMPNKQH